MFGYESPPETQTLHRDVFRWVQSLDLQHSLKNVRRFVTVSHVMWYLFIIIQMHRMLACTLVMSCATFLLLCCRDIANGYIVAEIFNRYFPVSDHQLMLFHVALYITSQPLRCALQHKLLTGTTSRPCHHPAHMDHS